MRPHVYIPRVILNEFRIEAAKDNSVWLLDKSSGVIRERGVNNNVFLGPSNYLGNGKPGTLEAELASNDESSIPKIIEHVRSGSDIQQYLPEIKILLGNHGARSPHYRVHPKVSERGISSPEQFHALAMDRFAGDYMPYPVNIFHIKSASASHSFVLPDFSLTHMVLSQDIVIMRFNSEDEHLVSRIKENEIEFVKWVNDKSYNDSQVLDICEFHRVIESNSNLRSRW